MGLCNNCTIPCGRGLCSAMRAKLEALREFTLTIPYCSNCDFYGGCQGQRGEPKWTPEKCKYLAEHKRLWEEVLGDGNV